VETIGSKRSYALIWCMPNNDNDDDAQQTHMLFVLKFLMRIHYGVT